MSCRSEVLCGVQLRGEQDEVKTYTLLSLSPRIHFLIKLRMWYHSQMWILCFCRLSFGLKSFHGILDLQISEPKFIYLLKKCQHVYIKQFQTQAYTAKAKHVLILHILLKIKILCVFNALDGTGNSRTSPILCNFYLQLHVIYKKEQKYFCTLLH